MSLERARGAVAVIGASGHTGRFVVAELVRRGLRPIAIGRDQERLKAAGFADRGVECRTALTDTPGSLDRAVAGAAVVVNCAGPFLDTADVVVRAALRARVHYLDLTAEQASAQATFDHFDDAARETGVVIIPAMGFFGGLADLLVGVAMADWKAADDVRVRIALDSWSPTQGTRLTGARNTAQRLVISEGRIACAPPPTIESPWIFPPPFGGQTLVELPFSEIPLIARRLKPSEAHTYLNTIALTDVRTPGTPPPMPVDDQGRSAQRFVVEATVRLQGAERRALATGQDIYAFSAPLLGEAVERILSSDFHGVGATAPASVFEAEPFLRALEPDYLTLQIHA